MFARNLFRLQNPKSAELFRNNLIEKREIWGYVAIAFNQVDNNRLEQVGPDRLCAEWLLKNGGAVRFKELPSRLVCDYNILPPESQKLHIRVADASNASIMKIGLEHFKDCNHIDTVILHNCKHLESDALYGLHHLKNSLTHLQVSGCYNMADESFKPLEELKKLNSLVLFDLRYVKNIDAVIKELQSKIPQCKIQVEKLGE